MNKLLDLYSELLELVYEQRTTFSDEDLCVFSKGVGRKYDNQLMVVGRATNGWGNCINKTHKEDYDSVMNDLEDSLDTENLDWVLKLWGKTDHHYNSKKSSFWRVIRMLASQLANSGDWPVDQVVWSNLYKVAPQSGNPSGRLMNLQFALCAQILRGEIEQQSPANVVFLTNLNWAGRFLKELEVNNELSRPLKFVQFAGIKNGIKYVVGQHPQGKPEQPHCAEIIETLNTLRSIAN